MMLLRTDVRAGLRVRRMAIEQPVQLCLPQLMEIGMARLEDICARCLKRTDDQLRAAFDLYEARGTTG